MKKSDCNSQIKRRMDFDLNQNQLPEKPNVTWEHSWPSTDTKHAVSESFFGKVPNEILLRIFRYLSVPDLCQASLVCRWFKMVVDQDEIWKDRCHTSMKIYSKSYKQMYMDWMHDKCLRNSHLRKIRRLNCFRTACVIYSPPPYPVRPTNEHRFQPIGGFRQHPNSSSSMTITVTVNLDKTAPVLIRLLEKSLPFEVQWNSPMILKQRIQRYYQFLKLKASLPSNILLIPTLDIELIWQTHLLRPEMYQADCQRLFHRIIDHTLLLNEIQACFKEQAFLDTSKLYEEKYGQAYCDLSELYESPSSRSVSQTTIDAEIGTYSYWDKSYPAFASEAPKDYENSFSFTEEEVIMDSKWLEMCKNFLASTLDRVNTEVRYLEYPNRYIHFRHGTIERLKKSYERFLYMAAKYPLSDNKGFIPPTYAIDIMWHAHMQEPLHYIADCQRLVGYVIYHAPWPIIEDEKMTKGCDKVNQIWKSEFSTDIETDHLFNTIDSRVDGMWHSQDD